MGWVVGKKGSRDRKFRQLHGESLNVKGRMEMGGSRKDLLSDPRKWVQCNWERA